MWLDSQRRGLVIECKSGIVSEGASISRHDAAQLSHSVDWFEENYPAAYGSVPVLVHPSNRLHEKASARQHTWVVTFEKLSALRSAVERFSVSVAEDRNWRDPGAVAKRLAEFNLTERNFLNSWAVPPR